MLHIITGGFRARKLGRLVVYSALPNTSNRLQSILRTKIYLMPKLKPFCQNCPSYRSLPFPSPPFPSLRLPSLPFPTTILSNIHHKSPSTNPIGWAISQIILTKVYVFSPAFLQRSVLGDRKQNSRYIFNTHVPILLDSCLWVQLVDITRILGKSVFRMGTIIQYFKTSSEMIIV